MDIGIIELEILEQRILNRIQETNIKIARLTEEMFSCYSIDILEKKNNYQESLKTYISNMELFLSNKIFDRLMIFDNQKINGLIQKEFLIETKQLYSLLSRWGFIRYKDIPDDWYPMGLYAGVIIELLSILRNPKEINLKNKQIQSINVIISSLNDYKYPFLTNIFHKTEEIERILKIALKLQHKTNLIGYFEDPNKGLCCYSYQHLVFDVPYSKKINKILENKENKENKEYPLYAIYFNDISIINKIWESRNDSILSLNKYIQLE